MTGGHRNLLIVRTFVFLISIIPLVYIGRKITGKQGRRSDRGSEERKGNTERSPSEEEATAPSTTTPEMGCFDCEVFISFRGKDTRKGFTSHLHKELESRGISTFLDSERLEKGQRISDLFKCIEGSKIFMPIFSKDYSESKWCLREIAKIVEFNRMEGEKRPIIPIFYDVHPSDVRHCRASFEKAFEKHQSDKKLGEEQIHEWRTALTEAGKICGYCLSETEGNEAKLITLIGARVSNILSKVPFDIKPIGMDSHINTLKKMLERGKKDTSMIGICGLGGIGKTTIAMALYNELSPTFEGSCFLSDIRENEKKEGLPSMQAKLMEEVLRGNMTIGNVRGGVSLMKRRLGNKKVLLILDDVEKTQQLEAFTTNRRENEEWFGAGSVVIVTTRNEEILVQHGLQKEEIYFPTGLDGEQSLQLLFRHAFVSDQLLAELGDLPQEIVGVAAGLPLALKVFGSHFSFLRKKQEWEKTLERVKTEQDKEVHDRLRISYEGLNDREKYIFLDIACFFIGENKEYSFYMWEGCGWYPHLALDVLQHRSLIKINQDDRFEMHDQIRDMGRMVVKEGSHLGDPLTYSRPWNKDQVLEVLKNAKVSKWNPHIQVLHLSRFYYEKVKMSRMGGGEMPKSSWKSIAAMPQLRMMIAGSEAAFNECEQEMHVPEKMLWLSWDWCPHETLTFRNNQHENLCILELHGGHFRCFGSPAVVLPKLKVLDLTWCSNLINTPNFTHLPSLVKLVLHYCTSLAELDESIGHLCKLEKLIMPGCCKLKRLPAGLCNLTSLEFLDLFGCKQISVLPEQIGNLKSLKYLNLGGTEISYIPQSVLEIQHLEKLNLQGCRKLSVLPKEMGVYLMSLRSLILCGTQLTDLPDSIGRLQSLEWLDLTGCSSLKNIPNSIGELKNLSWLSLVECKLLKQLPNSMGTLASLKILDIRNCELLTEVPDSLEDLNNDLKLLIEGCISLVKLPTSIRISASGTHFDEVQLNGLKSLRRLPNSVAHMKSICRLSLRDCKSLEEVPDSIGRLECLEVLDLSGCISLKRIPESIGRLKCLKCMSLKHCRSLEELPASMKDLKSLEVLHISGGMSIKKVPDFIEKLMNIRKLHVREIDEIPNLIDGLLRLEKICVKDCPKLSSLPQLPSSVTHLSVIGCKALPDLSGLESLNSLKELVLLISDGLGCKLMDKISQASFQQLKHLFIAGGSEGSALLFQLPKWQLFEQPIIVRLFCLVEEPPFNASHIEVHIQVKVEGKIVTEVTLEAREAKDYEVPERLGLEGKALYRLVLGKKEEEMFSCYIQEGQVTLRVSTNYRQYPLKMAYFMLN